MNSIKISTLAGFFILLGVVLGVGSADAILFSLGLFKGFFGF